MSIEKEEESQPRKLTKRKIIMLLSSIFAVAVAIGVFLFVLRLLQPPTSFSKNTALEIQPGMSVQSITQAAKNENIVSSELFLYVVLTYLYDPTTIHAGTYVFTQPLTLFEVATKLASSDVDLSLLSLTIPEGVRLTQIAEIAASKLPDFDIDEYLINTHQLEGYLFPETYFVPDTFTAEDLIDLQKTTYEEKIAPLRSAIEMSEFTEYEVLILASIIEREANDEVSMKMVSGILQNRLSIGMALQADATIEYVLDTPLNELPEGQLANEIRETQSPYNTYLYSGLVPTPIGNPGLQAIEAVLEPTKSDYFYYITDADGAFHYAETFLQHKQNIQRYLY